MLGWRNSYLEKMSNNFDFEWSIQPIEELLFRKANLISFETIYHSISKQCPAGTPGGHQHSSANRIQTVISAIASQGSFKITVTRNNVQVKKLQHMCFLCNLTCVQACKSPIIPKLNNPWIKPKPSGGNNSQKYVALTVHRARSSSLAFVARLAERGVK